MSNKIEPKIYRLPDDIDDETILNRVMEKVVFYATKKDIVDELTPLQLQELDEAVKEVENGETISLDEFKKDMSEWIRHD